MAGIGDGGGHVLAAGIDMDAEARELVVEGRVLEVGVEQGMGQGVREPGDVVRERLAVRASHALEDDEGRVVGQSELPRRRRQSRVVSSRRTSLVCTAPWASTERNSE